jgi:hypothetical protein
LERLEGTASAQTEVYDAVCASTPITFLLQRCNTLTVPLATMMLQASSTGEQWRALTVSAVHDRG